MAENVVGMLRTAEEAELRYLRATRFNPSLFPSEAGAVNRCRGGKGRRRVKLRTLKDGHKK